LDGDDGLFEIAQLRAALSRLPSDSGSSARPQAHAELAALAWMSRLDSLASPSTHAEMSPFADRPRLQLASLSPQTASSARLQDFGSSQITLPWYQESGGTAAVPSGNGQRLGQTNVKATANAGRTPAEWDLRRAA
jgi:hypothetical protein